MEVMEQHRDRYQAQDIHSQQLSDEGLRALVNSCEDLELGDSIVWGEYAMTVAAGLEYCAKDIEENSFEYTNGDMLEILLDGRDRYLEATEEQRAAWRSNTNTLPSRHHG